MKEKEMESGEDLVDDYPEEDVVFVGDLNYSKKPPKKKLTKAEKEKLKAEEAERRAKEEEEARIRMELEERERRERERLEAEERARLEELERIRRNAQMLELNAIYDSMKTTLNQMQEEYVVQRKWDRYMRCDGSPDPTIPGEINTYLNIQREENDQITFDEVLAESTLILSLIEELHFIVDDSPPTELPPVKAQELKETILQLESLLQFKLDQGSHRVFRDASVLSDQETGNLQKSFGGDVITLSCWANLSKNPRLKFQTFTGPAAGLVFEVPRPLTLADCAVRLLRTEFDHLSHLSPFYLPRVRTTPVVVEEEATTKKTESKKMSLSETKEGKDGDKDPLSRETTMPPSRGGTQTASGMQRSSGQSGAAAGAGAGGEESETEDENRDPATPEPEYIEFADFAEAEDVVDLRAFQVLGGVMHFDLLQLPPQPKTVRNWTITQVDQPAVIKRMTYGKEWRQGDDTSSGRASRASAVSASSAPSRQGRNSVAGQDDASVEISEEHGDPAQPQSQNVNMGYIFHDRADQPVNRNQLAAVAPSQATVTAPKKDPNPPFGLTFRIPNDCVFFEPPVVARWDYNDLVWKTSDMDDLIYEESTKTYSFKTYKFGPIACLQDRHLNFPFQGWELRPLSECSALFTINAALIDVEIEIKGNKCCLRKPTDVPQVQSFLGEWVVPKTLIKILRSKGINVFPNEDSRKYVQNSYKKKWMQENKAELWGLFLFPEEFLVPEEEPAQEEDDFFSFLVKPKEEEPEPEPVKKGKKGKKGKSKNKGSMESESQSYSVLGDKSTSSRRESEETSNLNKGKGKGKGKKDKSADSGKEKKEKKEKKGKKGKKEKSEDSGKGKKKKKPKEKPKTPQELLWEWFQEWLTHHRVKHTWIEGNLYQQMALCAHVLAFSFSKWNADSGEKRLVLQAAEAIPGQRVLEDVWGVFLITSKRVMALKMKENDETFSEELRDETEIQSNFFHMAQHIGSEGLIHRLKTVDYSFVKSVKELLDSTQVITYA